MKDWNLVDEEEFVVKTDAHHELTENPTKARGISVILCLDGNADVLVDIKCHKLEKNSQLVVLPGSFIEVFQESPDFRMLYISCSDSVFQEMSNSLEPTFFRYIRETPYVILPDEEVELLKKAAYLIKVAYEDETNCYRRQMAYNYVQNILFHFYNRTRRFFRQSDKKWVNRKEELFKVFLQLVHQHCSTQHDVSFYAQKMNITPRYLSSVVLAESGETTKDIIDRHVIVEIKVRLKNSTQNIQEIARGMNFNDQSFFSRYFRKHTGMSPLQYRNEV